MADELVLVLIGLGAGGMGFSLAWFLLGERSLRHSNVPLPMPTPTVQKRERKAKPKPPPQVPAVEDPMLELVTASPEKQEAAALATS
jgi:hypothetical protein